MELIIPDLHLGCTWDGVDRTEDVFSFLDELVNAVINVNTSGSTYPPSRFIWLGDIFDSPHISHSIVARFMEYLVKLERFDHIIISGNHDGDPEARKGSPLEEIQAFGSSRRSLGTVSVYFDPIKVGNETFIPYTTQEKLTKFLEDESNYLNQIIYTHLDLPIGAPGIEKEIGRGAPCVLPVEVINKAKKVYAGHIHFPQDINNLCVVGSAIKISITECKDQKRFIIDGVSVPINCRNLRHFELDFCKDDGIIEYGNLLMGGLNIKDSIVSVRIVAPHNKAHEFSESELTDSLWKQGAHHVRVLTDIVKEKNLRMRDLKTDMSDYEIIKGFIEGQGVSDQELILRDVEELLK